MEQESETHNPLPRLSIGDGRVSKRKSELMGIVDSSEDTVSDYSIFPATKDVESLELKSGKEKEVDRATSSRATSAGRFQTELNVILSFHNVWYDSSYGIAALQEQDVKAKPVDVIEELRRRLDDMDPREDKKFWTLTLAMVVRKAKEGLHFTSLSIMESMI